MIEREILDIINDRNDEGEKLNSIVDQFREGRPIDDLLRLLRSRNQELIGIGAWIIGEIQIDAEAIQLLVPQLRKLLKHEAPSIRLQAFNALYPTLRTDDHSTRLLVEEMCQDVNEGVRTAAKSAFERMKEFWN